MKKDEMIQIIKKNIHLDLVQRRVKKLCPFGNLEDLSKVQLQILLDIVDFESRW